MVPRASACKEGGAHLRAADTEQLVTRVPVAFPSSSLTERDANPDSGGPWGLCQVLDLGAKSSHLPLPPGSEVVPAQVPDQRSSAPKPVCPSR